MKPSMTACWQRHPNIDPAVGRVLVATPGHGRNGQAATTHLGFTQKRDEAAQIFIAQLGHIVSGDLEH
jgi:hypothetical protein